MAFVNKKIKMVTTDKTDYKVPEFLLNKLDYIPSPQDFLQSNKKASDEIPLWWTRDIDLPLTKGEYKRAAQKAEALKNQLESQRKKLENANIRFKALLEAQEKEYARRAEYLEKQAKAKLEELEILKQQNKLAYENRLLELELELQKTNLEQEFYKKEAEKIELYEKQSETHISEKQKIETALAALDEKLAAELQATAELKEQTVEEYKKIGKVPTIAVTNPDGVTEQSFMELPQTKIETFDVRNILEVKYLTLIDKDTGSVEIKNVTFDVKRKGITVVYSESERVLFNIVAAIMRTLPSNIQISGGDIRIDGESITAILRAEYREKMKGIINCLEDTLDRYARSLKSVRSEYKAAGISEEKSAFLLKSFELNQKIIRQKISKLDEQTRRKLAIMACLSMERPLTLMFEPEDEMSQEDKNRMIDLMHTQNTDRATLIFTTDKQLAGRLKSVSLYTF